MKKQLLNVLVTTVMLLTASSAYAQTCSGANIVIGSGQSCSTVSNIVDGQNLTTLTTGISTLNNAQGGNGSSAATTALKYSGNLPTNYNIIIVSASHYGQLSVTRPGGSTAFGVYAGSSITSKLYAGVLQGLTTSNIGANRTGSYSGLSWSLALQSGSSTIWDLIFTGGSTADTQQSLVNTSAALQNTFTLQNSVLANSFSYDCNVFGVNDVCVSAGGRNTQVSAANGLNNTSALLIAAYRVMPSVRIGAYADQNLSVNNAGSTVNLGNNTPLIGLFGAWNERLDGTGTEVKVSAAYGQKNTTVTRSVVGTSEAGSGSSQLNSQGVQVAAKYGFGVTPDVIVSPYVGMRYTQNNMNGYSEQATSSVTAPLTYSALNTNTTTALAGVGASYKFIPQATAFASAGVETDTNTSNGTYSATGVTGLTPINFNANPVKTRPTATVGAYYDIEKNQRLGITGIYRQEPYQAVQTTTVLATYTIGL
jgi:Autotransporter beta-domain